MSEDEGVRKGVFEYVESGLNNVALMEKYGPSYEGLRELLQELADAGFLGKSLSQAASESTRRIAVRNIVKDIRSGVSRSDLTAKYNLSDENFEKVLKRLVQAKAISNDELERVLAPQPGASEVKESRRYERYYLDFELPVWETNRTEVRGQVIDMTEKGLGVIGLPATLGEEKNLMVFSEEFLEIDPFSFDACCRWVKRARDSGEYVSGFEILKIQEPDLEELRKVIYLLTF